MKGNNKDLKCFGPMSRGKKIVCRYSEKKILWADLRVNERKSVTETLINNNKEIKTKIYIQRKKYLSQFNFITFI